MLLASVVGGPVAGVHEAGTALIDMLVKSDPEMKVALNEVTAALSQLARARRPDLCPGRGQNCRVRQP